MKQDKKIRSDRLAQFICALGAALLIVGYAASANAQIAQLVLREQIKVYSEIVTLGDFFENADDASNSPVFRSPSLGTSGIVSAKRVAASARQHGLDWPNMGGLTQIKVNRPGRLISMDEMREIISERAAADDDEAYTVTFNRGAKPFYIDPRAKGSILLKQMDHNLRSGRFRVVIAAPEGGQKIREKIFTGLAYATAEVIVPSRLIERGATIYDEDVKVVRMPRMRVAQSAIENIASAVGMAAKQRLVTGRPIRSTDLELPKLVKRNTIVTIVYESPGLSLKAKGRAMADASRGQTIAILNLQSKRTLDAKVIGNGLVSVSVQSAQPVRTALRAPVIRPALTTQRTRNSRNTNVIR